jgi:hypothetical protein
MYGQGHTALILQSAAERLLHPPRARNQLVERMHAGHGARELSEERDAGIVGLAHLLQHERSGLDHARDAENRRAIRMQPVEDLIPAVFE